MTISLDDALACVRRELLARRRVPTHEVVDLDAAAGRVLAEDITADRDQPPFDRSTRDGYAVTSASFEGDVPVVLDVVGSLAAGAVFDGWIARGQALEIMTGAPVPPGADAVVMVEHTELVTSPDAHARVSIRRAPRAGDNVVPRAAEARAGDVVLGAGVGLSPAALGLLASVGARRPRVFAEPRVAIVTTGDELVPLDATPTPPQIRNSNASALAAAVRAQGGRPVVFPIVGDQPEALTRVLHDALSSSDLLIVTGGVSAGKHDHVESVLASLGAVTSFDGVAIRPGRPVVFGWARDKPFFGLPGNPLSTLVTFGLFVRPAIALLAGARDAPGARFAWARLAVNHTQRPVPLTVFVPAVREPGDGVPAVRPLVSQGSGDLVTMAKADVLIAIEPSVGDVATGSLVRIWEP